MTVAAPCLPKSITCTTSICFEQDLYETIKRRSLFAVLNAGDLMHNLHTTWSGALQLSDVMELSAIKCRCSGDDGVNVCGDAQPIISDCLLQGKKCGLRAFGKSQPSLGQCRLQECGEQGIKAMDSARPSLTL